MGGMCFTDVEAYVDEDIEYPVRRYGCLPPDEGSLMQVVHPASAQSRHNSLTFPLP